MTADSPIPLVTPDEMRAWEARVISSGIAERLLMENAGRAAAAVVQQLYPTGRVVAAVGRGHNGGDALVLLRTLRAWGREVVAVPAGDATAAGELLHGWRLPIAEDPAAALAGAAVVVDAILGTGARGAPQDAAAALVRSVGASGRPVVALDGPTGVDLADGSVAADAVRATVTLAMGLPKLGLLLHPGRDFAGRILVLETGFPPAEPEIAAAAVTTAEWVAARLPRIAPNAHKGSVGAVTIVAGRPGLGGAPILAAHGALRAGAGLVRIATAEANRTAVHSVLPEAIFVDRAGAELDAALEAADAIVAGPGIGTDDAALALLERVVAAGAPLVLDADAITLLAGRPSLLEGDAAARTLLTPHPSEMARLLQAPTREIARNPVVHGRSAADRFGAAVLLKGAPSVVAAAGRPVLVNTTGHSGVATGGMGDTLAGVAGALLAAGAAPADAAALGVHLAGRAAEIAGRGRSLLPRDVADHLDLAIAETLSPQRADAVPGVLLDLPPAR